jgi:hypothetical protein
LDDGFGHVAGRHELLLSGVELERRKADCDGGPLWVLSRRQLNPVPFQRSGNKAR